MTEPVEKLIEQHTRRIDSICKKALGHLSEDEIKNRSKRTIKYGPGKTWPYESYYLDGFCFLEVLPVYEGWRLVRVDYVYHELPTHLKAKMD